MSGHPCDQLTEDQRVALRLTRDGLTSKQIALHLGLKSKTAIDQRLDRARATLHAPDRKAAARIHAEWEATRDRIIRDPEALVNRPRAGESWDQDAAGPTVQPGRIQEPHAAYGGGLQVHPGFRSRLVRTALGGRWNRLSIVERLRWMAATVLVLVLATFLLFAAYESLQRTLAQIYLSHG